eukprot:2857156-Pyramimonas_sp.AAC.1
MLLARCAQIDVRVVAGGQLRLKHVLVQLHGVLDALELDARIDHVVVSETIGFQVLLAHRIEDSNSLLRAIAG